MKKYLTILIIIIAFSLFSCYKETLYNGLEKILFVYNNIENDRSNNITVYTINIKGKDLKKIFNVKTTAPPYNSDIITNQETIELIEKNKEKVKFLFTKPLRCFSGNFCAYSNYLDSYDVVAGGEVYKGVYLYDLEKEEEIKIDNKIPDIIPSLFSKDGNLYITSLSFSYDGNYLFFVSINGNLYVYSILSNEVNKLIGSSEEIFGLRKVDRVGNLLYFILGDTESSLYEFNIITGEKNIISEPNTQYIIDPNGENLIYIRTSYINENVSNLGVINLKNREKIEKSFKEYRLNGFIKDSKHLIISSFPSKEKDYNSSIYLLDLNTLNLKEIFVP